MSKPWTGATGKFPRGLLNAGDEGELRMAIAADRANGIVRLDFGKPVAWLGLPAAEARALGSALLQKADEVDR